MPSKKRLRKEPRKGEEAILYLCCRISAAHSWLCCSCCCSETPSSTQKRHMVMQFPGPLPSFFPSFLPSFHLSSSLISSSIVLPLLTSSTFLSLSTFYLSIDFRLLSSLSSLLALPLYLSFISLFHPLSLPPTSLVRFIPFRLLSLISVDLRRTLSRPSPSRRRSCWTG